MESPFSSFIIVFLLSLLYNHYVSPPLPASSFYSSIYVSSHSLFIYIISPLIFLSSSLSLFLPHLPLSFLPPSLPSFSLLYAPLSPSLRLFLSLCLSLAMADIFEYLLQCTLAKEPVSWDCEGTLQLYIHGYSHMSKSRSSLWAPTLLIFQHSSNDKQGTERLLAYGNFREVQGLCFRCRDAESNNGTL